jgi:hypothetical protein
MFLVLQSDDYLCLTTYLTPIAFALKCTQKRYSDEYILLDRTTDQKKRHIGRITAIHPR